VRRRRECGRCGSRFTTYEYVAERTPRVRKRSGAVEDFDRYKLLRGLKVACAKRPVSTEELERIADGVEEWVSQESAAEASSQEIGAMLMERLRSLDRVAYVRFASVYRNFQGAGEFEELVGEMSRNRQPKAASRGLAGMELAEPPRPNA